MNRHAGTGAAIAAFIAALWVAVYIFTGSLISPFGPHISLIQIVFNDAYDISNSGGMLLLRIVARFVLAFGLLWLPITAALSLLRPRRQQREDEIDVQ
jgi:hypothetical protein